MSISPKALFHIPLMGRDMGCLRGQRVWHATKADRWNVGDPSSSSIMGVSADKCNSEGAEMGAGKSEGAHYR